jgi:hypothetical protein
MIDNAGIKHLFAHAQMVLGVADGAAIDRLKADVFNVQVLKCRLIDGGRSEGRLKTTMKTRS